MSDYRLSEKAEKALKLWQEGCLASHSVLTQKRRERYRSYRGFLDQTSDTVKKLEPDRPHNAPWAQHIIDSTLAGLVDDKFAFRVTPLPRFYEPGEYELVRQGAKAHEILHRAQFKQDRFSEKQWPFALEDAIGGLAIAKNYYRREKTVRPRLKMVPHPELQAMGIHLPTLMEVEEPVVTFDGCVTEIVNGDDFFWHEAATELQGALVVAHRVWESFPSLKRQEALGLLKNVDELKEKRDYADDYVSKRAVDGSSRSKDMIEVLEVWWYEDDGGVWCVTLGNRCVELKAARANPFWHGEYPFVTCSTRPDRFAVAGVSQVEKIARLQELHWFLSTQAQMNVELLNNQITMYDASLGDLSAFPREPGAMWPVDGDPNQMIRTWTPDPTPANIALPHLSRLEQQMQNLAGGQPFTSTSEAANIGASTATEAALATNLAQRSTTRLKQQLNFAYERMGQQRTALNQQFIRTSVMVEQIGLDSEQELVEIAPYLLQGDFLFDVSPMNESLMRSERRAEANSMIQVLGTLLMPWLQMASQGLATMPNLDAFLERWLEGYDVGDPRQFFSSKKPPQQMGAPGGQQQQGAVQNGMPQGTTAQQSIDPAVSPSANASLSGESHAQQALAARGQSMNT